MSAIRCCAAFRRTFEPSQATLLSHRRQIAPVAAKFHAPGLRGLQRFLGPLRDHLPLRLGDQGHDAHDHLVGLGHVGGNKPDAGLLRPEKAMRVAAQPVQLGDDQGGVVKATSGQSLRQLRPVVISPALHLDVLGDQPPRAAVEIVEDGLALRLQSEAGGSLPISANSQVRHELAAVFLAGRRLRHFPLIHLLSVAGRRSFAYGRQPAPGGGWSSSAQAGFTSSCAPFA
jgi:hypothetical protein